jgi:RimJ/RimL family protein N-acetyltransferase
MPFPPAPVVLVGGHVRLEPLERRHAPGLFEAGRDPSVWRYMTIPPFEAVADAEAFVESAVAEETAGRQLPFATIDAQTDRVVGSTRYLDIQPAHRSIEIGFTWLSPEAQRTAINTEAKLLLLGHAFESLGAQRVCLKTDRENVRSQEAIARIGGVREGTLRAHMILWSGRVRDTVYFSILDAEWPSVKAKLEARLARG